MSYAIIKDGKIVGESSRPNETSSDTVDKNSKEWKDYDKEQDDKKAKRDKHSDISMDQVIDELEARFPGFAASARAR